MPRGDVTIPWGHGPRTERGLGGCNPRRRSFEFQGQARARFGARQGRAQGRRLDIRTGQAQVFGSRHLGQWLTDASERLGLDGDNADIPRKAYQRSEVSEATFGHSVRAALANNSLQ